MGNEREIDIDTGGGPLTRSHYLIPSWSSTGELKRVFGRVPAEALIIVEDFISFTKNFAKVSDLFRQLERPVHSWKHEALIPALRNHHEFCNNISDNDIEEIVETFQDWQENPDEKHLIV